MVIHFLAYCWVARNNYMQQQHSSRRAAATGRCVQRSRKKLIQLERTFSEKSKVEEQWEFKALCKIHFTQQQLEKKRWFFFFFKWDHMQFQGGEGGRRITAFVGSYFNWTAASRSKDWNWDFSNELWKGVQNALHTVQIGMPYHHDRFLSAAQCA